MTLEDYNSEIGKVFRSYIKRPNILTPDLMGYIKTNYGIAEISTGSKFLGNAMFGITIINHDGTQSNLSKCVNSYKEVIEYINYLNYEDLTPLVNLLNRL